jgi:peptidoglycan hydrolase-like protein with peptidoglycan-binding domain
MIKRRLGLVVGFAVAAGLGGCGSDTEATSLPPPPALVSPAAQPTPTAPPAEPTPRVMPGQHPRIAQVQTALNANGAHLQVDGRSGPKTTAALKAFQRQHKLKVTGQPDSATVKVLGV